MRVDSDPPGAYIPGEVTAHLMIQMPRSLDPLGVGRMPADAIASADAEFRRRDTPLGDDGIEWRRDWALGRVR